MSDTRRPEDLDNDEYNKWDSAAKECAAQGQSWSLDNVGSPLSNYIVDHYEEFIVLVCDNVRDNLERNGPTLT